ncbi:hypothetical protein [Mangrovicoccus algicola]|uniref:Uncharacterized protein n=1 Tax=Mangrovicoccus algicola TaxID=2771008 RepID=A0A8J7CHW7_9RHOB|nr:hypothetical protein [Mangrovicoccus algicola]MBE3638805.1 hypothetical protein [Mangrovicoccus algicola]
MTDPTNAALRARLDIPLDELLDRLPRLGRAMVIARSPSMLLERLGTIETARIEGSALILAGADHDARIETARVAELVADRTTRMGDRVLPRIELRDAADQLTASIVGMEGLEGFDAALAGLPETGLPPLQRDPPQEGGAAPELAEDDPVLALLTPLREAGAEVAITLDVPGMTQGWAGQLPEFRPMMGWFNIISRTFHLHVEAGAVTAWQAEPGRRVALGRDGRPTGLVVVSDALA